MKRFLSIAGLTLVLCLSGFQSDIENLLMDLKFGNIDQVSNRFYDFIEMRLPDETIVKSLNRMEAKNTLRTFFNRNKIQGFQKDDDQADGISRIIRGKLPNKGDGFYMTILMRQINGKYWILAIRVDKL